MLSRDAAGALLIIAVLVVWCGSIVFGVWYIGTPDCNCSCDMLRANYSVDAGFGNGTTTILTPEGKTLGVET